MRARRRFIVDADLAEADPACEALEEAIALRELPQRGCRARRQQAEVAGIFRNFLPRAPIDQCVEALHRQPAQEGFIVAMGFGRVDDIVAVIDPVADQCFDQGRRVLAVAIHEQHRAASRVVQSGHQGGFLAEIARQGHHLNVECVSGKLAGDGERIVFAAVVDINHFAGEAVTLAQRPGEAYQPLMQRCQARGLIVQRHDDRKPLRRGIGRGCRQARNVRTQHHRSGSKITPKPSPRQHMLLVACCRNDERNGDHCRRNASSLANSGFSRSWTYSSEATETVSAPCSRRKLLSA